MCDSQWAQVIDNRPLSMLGEEISCSSARFVGLKNPREQRERGREGGKKDREKLQRDYAAGTELDGQTDSQRRQGQRKKQSNLLEIKSDRTDGAVEKKERNYGSLSPFTSSPLDRYQPSGYSITLDPIFLKTVSLSSFCLCHSIFFPPSQSEFSCRLETYIIFYCTGLVGLLDCYFVQL